MTSSQPMVIDHVARLVPEIEAAERSLRELGPGVHRGPYHAFMGARSYTMPLVHPQYLELHALPITYAGGRAGVRSGTIRTAAGDQTFQ